MEALVLLAVLGALILVPLLILKAFVHLLLGLILLPFKLVGAVFQIGFGLLAGLLKLLASGALVVLVLLFAVGALVLLPLLPFLVVGGLVWLAVRASRPVVRAA